MSNPFVYRFLKFRKQREPSLHCAFSSLCAFASLRDIFPAFSSLCAIGSLRDIFPAFSSLCAIGSLRDIFPAFSSFRFLAAILFFTAIISSSASAGQEASTWYFGDSVAVRFDASGPVSVGVGGINTSEGCAVWSDPTTGTPLLYTDGTTVWNGTGAVLTNGTDLMGHESSTQSALLIPQPGNANRFFLFTAGVGPYFVPDNNGIRYSIVDIATNTVVVKNVPLLAPAAEKLVAIPHCNGRDYWAVSQEWGTNNFHAWQVTASGVSSRPVVSSTGTIVPLDNDSYTIGFLKSSPDGRRLVSTGYYPGAVQLFDFNSSAGIVSNPLSLPFNGSVYGASFSPDNTKLYIADQQLGSQSLIRIYQFTITGTPAEIIASRTAVFQFVGGAGDELGALQIAPDGKIYCAREGGQWLGVINNPNAPGLACDYVHDGLYLNGRRSLLGLPNFIDAGFNTGLSCLPAEALFALDTAICAGMCIDIQDKSLHQPSSWRWSFPGGTPSSFFGQHPVNICYHTPGTYNVRLIVANSQGVDTLELRDAVTVLPRLGASAGADVGICPGGSAMLTGSGGSVYRWEPTVGLDRPDSATTSAQPSTTTTYILTVQEGSCIDRDTVTVTVFPPPVVRGGMYVVCPGDSVRHNAAGSPGTYRWEPDTGVSDPDAAAPMLFPAATTDYTVTLTDANGCSTSAVVHVEVGEAAVDAGRDTSLCRGSSVVLRPSGLSGSYNWTPAEGLDDPTSATPTATPATTTTYVVTVTGGSCTAVDSITIVVRDLPFVNAGNDVAICRNGEVVLSATGSMGTYRWEPSDGVENPDAPSSIVRPATTTTYRVTVTDENGCTASDEITVTVDVSLVVDAGADIRLCSGDSTQLDAYIGEGTYSWSPKEGLDDPTSPRPKASPRSTTVYRLVVNTAAGCSGTDSLTVTVLPLPSIDAGENVVICSGDTTRLQANTDDSFVGWEPASGLDNALAPMPRAFPAATTLYIATSRSADGCLARDSVLVEVQALSAGIAEPDTAICAGAEIVLHAVGGGPFRWEPASLVDDPQAAVVRARPLQRTVFVLSSGAGSCRSLDSITVDIRESAQLQIALPDTVVAPGSPFRLPVWARLTSSAGMPESIDLEFSVAYDRRVLDIPGSTRGKIVGRNINGTIEKLVVRIDDISTDSLEQGMAVTELVGTGLLSTVDTTGLVLSEIVVTGADHCIAVVHDNGTVRIDGYCLASDFRRFERPRVVVAPNPASDVLKVVISPISQSATITIESVWGTRLISDAAAVTAEGGVVDISSLPAGVYYVVVQSGQQRIVVPVCIVR